MYEREVAIGIDRDSVTVRYCGPDGTAQERVPLAFRVSAEQRKLLVQYAQKYEPAGFRDDDLYSTGDFYKGNLYGYQTDGDTYLAFYRKDWLADKDENKRFSDKHGRPLAIPETWECPRCGFPAGQDEANPPAPPRVEPYKTHLAYVKERRSDADGEAILAEALQRLRG